MEPAASITRPGRILVVDDEPEILHLLKVFLSESGHQVTVVSSGQEALSALTSAPFDLAIVDLNMPGMDGFELTAQIRAAEVDRRMPILFLTAHYDDREWSTRSRELGADDFVLKPISRRALAARVGALLRLARSGAERPALYTLRAFFEAMLEGVPACVIALGSGDRVLGAAGRVQEILGGAISAGMLLDHALPRDLSVNHLVRRLVRTALSGSGEASGGMVLPNPGGMRFIKVTVRRVPKGRGGGEIRAVVVIEEVDDEYRADETGVVELGVTDYAAAAAELAGAIENHGTEILGHLRMLGETGERLLRIVETVHSGGADREQQPTLAALRTYWRTALRESAVGARAILNAAQELRGGLPAEG